MQHADSRCDRGSRCRHAGARGVHQRELPQLGRQQLRPLLSRRPRRTRLEKSAALDTALAELVAMPGGPPGVISIVQVDDDRTVHTAGVADLSTGAAPTVLDHMRIASAAKAFSGATALSLVDQGKLSLDDTIGERLPSMPAAWAAVTLRQLLSHTSGLPDFTKSPGLRCRPSAHRWRPHRRPTSC